MIRTIIRSAPLPLIAALLVAAAPAAAIDYDVANVRSVPYTDLDLSQDSGVATLHRRIALATRMVCGTFHPGDLTARQQALSCRRQTVAAITPTVALAVASARGGERLAKADIPVSAARN